MRPLRFTLLACTLACLFPVVAQASFPGANGELVYDHNYWQPVNSIGTTAPTPPFSENYWCCYISTGPVPDPRNAAWSPDGRRLAFDAPATSPGTGRALYVMNADGTGLRQVGRGDRLRYNPAWSPSGTRLAFVQDNGSGGSGDIYTMTTSGGSLTRLTTSAAWDGSPDWSSDNRIAYTCRSGTRNHVCQMSSTGSGKTVTTAALGVPGVIGASWSPSGANLAFATTGGANGYDRIFRVSRSGTSLRELTPKTTAYGPVGSPAWSPDAQRIAFDICNSGECGLATVRATDGSGLVEIMGNDDRFPIDPGGWRPLR